MRVECLAGLFLVLLSVAVPAQQSADRGGRARAARPDDPRAALRVGHWVRVKGTFDQHGWFVAQKLELRDPEDKQTLIGTARSVDRAAARFSLHGLPMFVVDRTEWKQIDWERLSDARVEVTGHYRGPSRFSARQISPRTKARDRLEARIDAIEPRGEDLLLRMMSFDVLLSADALIVADKPVEQFALAPQDESRPRSRVDEEDDFIPASFALSESLAAGLQLEWKESNERDFNLRRSRAANKRKGSFSTKALLTWRASEDIFALARLRWNQSHMRDQNGPNSVTRNGGVTELNASLRDPLGLGLDFQIGRQDFDDQREFLYDRNLDAVRMRWHGDGVGLELSGSTVLNEGSPDNRHTDNWIAYLSNDDDRQHLAAWVVDRRREGKNRASPLHAGLRALGEWLPDQELWAEFSIVRGFERKVDLRGWAVDLGTTLDAHPFYFTLGFAHGSGDPDPTDDVDQSHRQTGLQDNNGKFGGVTSFKYFGEVLQPELSNLDIYTAGVGLRVGRRSSIDLVAHRYRLDRTFLLDPAVYPNPPPLIHSRLRRRPDGLHTDLGWELDLVLGSRETDAWDLELVLGLFEPGAAFPGADPAWVWRSQIRHRF